MLAHVYAVAPDHPGILHDLIHVNDDPVNAQQGLIAARAYAESAAAVPHAQHMPSHIFTRLGSCPEQAATNENIWHTSEADVKRAGESGAFRDFHLLSYLQYAYLQVGRFKDAKWATDVIAKQYAHTANKTTAVDTPLLEARHVRGRTIYAQPDRVAYGYFDMLARYIVETHDWSHADALPLVQTMAAAKRGGATSAAAYARRIAALAEEPGQQPFAQRILRMQAKEAAASAAAASGKNAEAVAFLGEAIAIEDGIDSLSQPPYPFVPANELLGDLLMEMHQPAGAQAHYASTLKRSPGRPMAMYGIARAAAMLGDRATAMQRYAEFLAQWKSADAGLEPVAIARRYVASSTGTLPR
ncbi:MAG: hypothetical protein NVS2B3_09040 [Vulcanimicrobiaceae bacterium]